MNIKVGFIGTGNMGTAMIKSLANNKALGVENLFIFDIDEKKIASLIEETSAIAAGSGAEVVEKADIIFLAVKPNIQKKVLEDCRKSFNDKKILVSVAVGVPISFYKSILGEKSKVIRTMPNTPALVGEGMTLISCGDNIGAEDMNMVKKLMESFGKAEFLEERLMTEVTALTGSSPAYVFMFIESMADAAVQSGIPRDMAYRLAAQTVLGSAKMVLETGKHPGELKDQVCSPAGTTIEAVAALEKNGFRHAVMEAMKECSKRAAEIGKGYE